MLHLLLEHNLKYREFSIDLLLRCLFLSYMESKRNVSFTNLFTLLQAKSVHITIIILILAKHSYPLRDGKGVITQRHHLHVIQENLCFVHHSVAEKYFLLF